MEPDAKLKVSFKRFVLNIVGAVLAGLGVWQLQDGRNVMDSALGGACLLAGVALMVWFLVDIFKRIRAAQSARLQQETR